MTLQATIDCHEPASARALPVGVDAFDGGLRAARIAAAWRLSRAAMHQDRRRFRRGLMLAVLLHAVALAMLIEVAPRVLGGAGRELEAISVTVVPSSVLEASVTAKAVAPAMAAPSLASQAGARSAERPAPKKIETKVVKHRQEVARRRAEQAQRQLARGTEAILAKLEPPRLPMPAREPPKPVVSQAAPLPPAMLPMPDWMRESLASPVRLPPRSEPPKPTPPETQVTPQKPPVKEAAKPKPQPRTKPKTPPARRKETRAGGVQARGKAPGKAAAPARAGASAGALNAYALRVRAAIARNRPAGRGARGRIVVTFAIGPSGGLRFARVTRSSGDGTLDQRGLAAVRRSAPFPRPPAAATPRQLTYVIPIEFK
ncbi:MAG: TonB family protein [Hyphomicrobiaceae bacterium]